MKIKLLLVTHESIGESLLAVARLTLGDQLPLPVKIIAVAANANPDSLSILLTITNKKIKY